MCIKDGLCKSNEEYLDKDLVMNYLYACDDLSIEEVEDIMKRIEDVDREFVENIGNDVDSYWQYTCYDKDGLMVVVFEVYSCKDYVNLLEYDDLLG